MVLQDLSARLSGALSTLTHAPTLTESTFETLLKDLSNALISSDINISLVTSLRKRIKSTVKLSQLPPHANKKRIIQKAVFDALVEIVNPGVKPFEPKRGRRNVIMLVGLQGAGKTTTATKLAKFYQTRGFKTGLVCADTFRAGAFDQLKQNAIKAKIPYYGSLTELDPVAVAREGVERFKREKFEVIIVDTSGRHRQEEALFEEMKDIGQAVKPDTTIMVLDGSIGQAAQEQSRAFKAAAGFGGIVITKMDGAAAGGGAVSAVAATHTPIVFVGTGEHVHDLEKFKPEAFVSKLLGMGDLSGLVEHVSSLRLEQKDTMRNMAEGKFTVRNLRDQLTNVMKMGPLSKMAGMIPGLQAATAGMDDAQGSEKLKRMVMIMDSMTAKELDSDGRILTEQPGRVIRVARGAGTSVQEVEDLLAQQRLMAGMAKKFKGMGAQQNMPGNKQQMAAMQKRMQSLGMGGGRGMPDMSSLMGGGMDMGKIMQMMSGMR